MLLLERGKNIEHVNGYPNARKGQWEYPHRGGRTLAMKDAYPVLKRDYPLNEKNLDWWVNEKESPYPRSNASTGIAGITSAADRHMGPAE